MSGFDSSWLDLREPADHRSRNEELAQAAHARASGGAGKSPCWIWAAAPARTCAPPRRCWARSSTGRWSITTRACCRRRSRGSPRGPTAASAATISSCCTRAASASRCACRAPTSPTTSIACSHRARSRHGVGAVRPGLARFHLRGRSRGRAQQGGLLHRAHLQRPAALDAQARGGCRHGLGLPRPSGARQGLRRGGGPMAPALLSAAFDAAGYSVSEGDSAWRLEAGDEALIAELVPGFADAVRETGLVPKRQDRGLAQSRAHRRPRRPHRHAGAARGQPDRGRKVTRQPPQRGRCPHRRDPSPGAPPAARGRVAGPPRPAGRLCRAARRSRTSALTLTS